MAFRGLNLLKNIRYGNVIFCNISSNTTPIIEKTYNLNKFRTENNVEYLEDPDCFGTLSKKLTISEKLEDDGDIKEEQFLSNIPLKSQQLSIKQYADLIKQYLKVKRIKEAIDVLETRMLKEDRIKPENYIYNILIGACAEVGYTKKAFKLFNELKRRALKPTGDTYTCLFEACMNSPWPAYGLKMATHLRNLMIEKGIEPNITNFNVMIKTFGRCSDLPTAFKLVDEMKSKKIKIRVHTFNHLLHACISNKENGMKHALVVWRKMLNMREKPNIYSFNLMLKCVKDCNIGGKEDILDIISIIQEHNMLLNPEPQILQIENSQILLPTKAYEESEQFMDNVCETNSNSNNKECVIENTTDIKNKLVNHSTIVGLDNKITFVKKSKLIPIEEERSVPNLLSKFVRIDKVLALQDITTLQDKFAVIGGQDDFLKEMKAYSVKPDVKIFTQMLPLIDNSTEAENKLIKTMKELKVQGDIDFYNMLIKKRCLRLDYGKAFDVRSLIESENKTRKTHPLNKKNEIKVNIMTYGVLAMACNTRAKALELLNEMQEKQLKVNIEILGTLLRNGVKEMQFGYILYIMEIVKTEGLKINGAFIKHLEAFNDNCLSILDKNKKENCDSPKFTAAYKHFSKVYVEWLKEMNVSEALQPEHPWKQYMEPQPKPIQREHFSIAEPKKLYKRNRKFVSYTTKV